MELQENKTYKTKEGEWIYIHEITYYTHDKAICYIVTGDVRKYEEDSKTNVFRKVYTEKEFLELIESEPELVDIDLKIRSHYSKGCSASIFKNYSEIYCYEGDLRIHNEYLNINQSNSQICTKPITDYDKLEKGKIYYTSSYKIKDFKAFTERFDPNIYIGNGKSWCIGKDNYYLDNCNCRYWYKVRKKNKMNKALEFENIERKRCSCSNTCDYSCTTCPISPEVVDRWEEFE